MANDVSHPARADNLEAARSSVVEDVRPMPLVYLCLLALVVGIVAGLRPGPMLRIDHAVMARAA